MSQIFYEEVTLDELVNFSTAIVVGTRTDPPARTEQITVEQNAGDGSEAPPFNYVVQCFVVESVIRGDLELAGQTIDVSPPDIRSQFESHVEYYVNGLSKSPIVPCYSPKGDTESNSVILFLSGTPDFEFCMDGAMEGLELEGKIRRLATQGTTDVYPTVTPRLDD